jgi:glutathione S-transferase
MILFGSALSPFVRKVVAFAAEKGIEIESRPVALGSDDPEFLAASPFRKMPALSDGDFRIADSSAIVHYLEALRPEPALIPAEPRARARTIWYDEFADTILGGCGTKMFFNRIVAPRFMGREGDAAVADRAEHEELPPILDYLEGGPAEPVPGRGPADAGRYFGGEHLREPAASRAGLCGGAAAARRLCGRGAGAAELRRRGAGAGVFGADGVRGAALCHLGWGGEVVPKEEGGCRI